MWGVVGGIPQYLAWWNTGRSVEDNLQALVSTPGGRLLTEGELVMATEGGTTELASQVLYAIAARDEVAGGDDSLLRINATDIFP